MFVKNASYPLRDGKEKHVVTISVRPIGNGHTYAMAGYQAANADQDERSHGSEDGKAIKPRAVHEMASLRMSLIYRINNNARRSVPEEADTPRVRMTIYLASRLKSTFAGAPSFTSSSCVAMPALRC